MTYSILNQTFGLKTIFLTIKIQLPQTQDILIRSSRGSQIYKFYRNWPSITEGLFSDTDTPDTFFLGSGRTRSTQTQNMSSVSKTVYSYKRRSGRRNQFLQVSEFLFKLQRY